MNLIYEIYVLYRTFQIKKTNSQVRRFVEFQCSECGKMLKPKELSGIEQRDLSLLLLRGIEIECSKCGTINGIPEGERLEVKRYKPPEPIEKQLRFLLHHC